MIKEYIRGVFGTVFAGFKAIIVRLRAILGPKGFVIGAIGIIGVACLLVAGSTIVDWGCASKSTSVSVANHRLGIPNEPRSYSVTPIRSDSPAIRTIKTKRVKTKPILDRPVLYAQRFPQVVNLKIYMQVEPHKRRAIVSDNDRVKSDSDHKKEIKSTGLESDTSEYTQRESFLSNARPKSTYGVAKQTPLYSDSGAAYAGNPYAGAGSYAQPRHQGSSYGHDRSSFDESPSWSDRHGSSVGDSGSHSGGSTAQSRASTGVKDQDQTQKYRGQENNFNNSQNNGVEGKRVSRKDRQRANGDEISSASQPDGPIPGESDTLEDEERNMQEQEEGRSWGQFFKDALGWLSNPQEIFNAMLRVAAQVAHLKVLFDSGPVQSIISSAPIQGIRDFVGGLWTQFKGLFGSDQAPVVGAAPAPVALAA